MLIIVFITFVFVVSKAPPSELVWVAPRPLSQHCKCRLPALPTRWISILTGKSITVSIAILNG